MKVIFRHFKSSAFQLTLLYIGMFGASVAVLMIFIYLFMEKELETNIKNNINVQLADLGRKFILYGTGETISSIKYLIDNDKDKSAIYMLINPQWEVVAGNLEKWPGGSTNSRDWINFTYEKRGKPYRAIGINSTLPEGYILMVGSTLESIDRIGDTLMNWLSVIIGMTVIMALLGGIVISLNISGRIENINQVCRRVMAGDLERRVKVQGSGDSFDKLSENFNMMMGRICELIDGIRDISISVAHDLRTPLNRVRHRLENISKYSADKDKLKEEVKAAINEVDDLVATFNAILRISQAEAGAGKEQFQAFNLSDQVNNVMELYSAVADEKSIQIVSKISSDIMINGDKHLLTQAIANLVDNAVKYTPDKGKIKVELKMQNAEIILSVSDNGPGIPIDLYNKVTEKFFRVESSRNTSGNGLGLSLAKAAFTLHEGEMMFYDNNPGLKVVVRFI